MTAVAIQYAGAFLVKQRFSAAGAYALGTSANLPTGMATIGNADDGDDPPFTPQVPYWIRQPIPVLPFSTDPVVWETPTLSTPRRAPLVGSGPRLAVLDASLGMVDCNHSGETASSLLDNWLTNYADECGSYHSVTLFCTLKVDRSRAPCRGCH